MKEHAHIDDSARWSKSKAPKVLAPVGSIANLLYWGRIGAWLTW